LVVQSEAVVVAPKAKYRRRPIAEKYREGKVKRSRVGSERVKIQESKPTCRTRIEHGPRRPPQQRGEGRDPVPRETGELLRWDPKDSELRLLGLKAG